MMETTPRTPRQPKLRFSCDGCGAAKLKCDRGQPECRRCVTLGITCVYGVSRKMGKPRKRLQIPAALGVPPRTPGERSSSSNDGRSDDNRNSHHASNSTSDAVFSKAGSRPSVNDRHSVWDEFPNDVVTSVEVLDAFHNDRLGPSSTNMPSLHASQWNLTKGIGDDLQAAMMGSEPFLSMDWPEFEDSPASTAQTTASHSSVNDKLFPDSPLMQHGDNKCHDCLPEAYDILGSLSFNKAYPTTTSAPYATTKFTNHVPLDFILHLNREASGRLGRLLGCSCANQPHLAFLYASIISRVLFWYCQEAGCSKLSSQSPTPDTALSPPSSIFGSFCRSPSSRLSMNTSASGSSMPPSTRATTPNLAPTQITMGSFNIDDQRVQTALRIQLILGEMKRISSLIEAISSWSSSVVDESMSGNVDTLYRSLGAWLEGEHSRIVVMMRSRLREIGI
ncbi:hypothetical protein F4677DRAFT_410195 [Hypoxylon crocopeplum]|nr:hypothetical protein F4677DRAFT_410195 [Hypoxylon crocopeplum]